jgi:hypothetical protein
MQGTSRPEGPAIARGRSWAWRMRTLALLAGALVGLFAASIDQLSIVAFTFVSALWLMTSAIPGTHARDFRKVVTGFFLLALPVSWVLYLSTRGFFPG